jgi:F-type H+-transporting ATPase subunit b
VTGVLIDWFTVAAQAVNFLILVWLLRRFLYRPISEHMAERARRIDAQLQEAQHLRDEAAAEREQLEEESARLSAQRDERLRHMREELDATRRAQLKQARAEVDELQARWLDAVQREKEGFLIGLQERVADEIVAVVRRALADLADETLESRMVDRFLARLADLDSEDRERLTTAAQRDSGRLHLRTAFALPAEVRDRVTATVHATIGGDCDLRFEVTPTLLAGLELRAGGQALAWTFDDYLEALTSAVAESFGEEWSSGAPH